MNDDVHGSYVQFSLFRLDILVRNQITIFHRKILRSYFSIYYVKTFFNRLRK